MVLYIITLLSALIAGFGTGLLGIGGGLIIYPVFLFIVPMLGYETLSINEISGIATIQIVAGSFFAFLSHRKNNTIGYKSLITVVIIASFGCLIGGLASARFPEKLLLGLYLFILMTSFSSLTVFKGVKFEENGGFKKHIVNLLCVATGFLAGVLGLGGAVLYIPILRFFYRLSTKEAISSVTFIVFCGSLMTFAGKVSTGQIPFELIIYTLAGSFGGAKLGAYVSKRTDSTKLRKALIALIILTAIRVLVALLS